MAQSRHGYWGSKPGQPMNAVDFVSLAILALLTLATVLVFDNGHFFRTLVGRLGAALHAIASN